LNAPSRPGFDSRKIQAVAIAKSIANETQRYGNGLVPLFLEEKSDTYLMFPDSGQRPAASASDII
jgi:hypothetical protein